MRDISDLASAIGAWLMPTPRETALLQIEHLGWAIGTSLGSKRKRNEDRACIARIRIGNPTPHDFFLAIVCDGLGGMQGGDECAATAISTVIAQTYHRLRQNERHPTAAVVQAVRAANDKIYERFRGQGGATISVLILTPRGDCVAINVGDSRIYELKSGEKLVQLTLDDNIAAEVGQLRAVAAASLGELEFGEHLTQFVGIGPDIRIRPIPFRAQSESSFLLASDGAWRHVNGVFQKVALEAPNANELVKRTIQVANWVGGHDNTTVLAVSMAALARTEQDGNPLGQAAWIDLWSPYDHWSLAFNLVSTDVPPYVGTGMGRSGAGGAGVGGAGVGGAGMEGKGRRSINARPQKRKDQRSARQEPLISEGQPEDSQSSIKPITEKLGKSAAGDKQLNIEIVIEDHAKIDAKDNNSK